MAFERAPADNNAVALYALAVELGASLDTTSIVDGFMTWLARVVLPDAAALALEDWNSGDYRVVATHGIPTPTDRSFPDVASFVQWFRATVPTDSTDIDVHDVPLRHRAEHVGHLVMLLQQDAPPSEHDDILMWAAPLVAAHLSKARRYHVLQEELAGQRTAHAETEALYQALMEQALAGVYLFRDDTFLYVNRALAEMFGYTPEELIGKRGPLDLTHPDDHPLVQEKVRERLQQKMPYARYRFRGLCKDGHVIYLEAYGQRVQYKGKAAIFGLLIDVTEQVRMEEAYRALVDYSLQGLSILQDGRLVFVNRALVETTGYSEEELLALTPDGILSLVHPEDRARMAQAIQSGLAGQPMDAYYQFRYIRKDGRVRWAEARGSRILYRGRPALQLAYLDITRRKEAEQRLERQLASLRTLGEIFGHINRTPDVSSALTHALEMMLDALNLHMGALWFFGEDGESPNILAVRGIPDEQGHHLLQSLGHYLPADIWEHRDVWVVQDWFDPPSELTPIADIMRQLGVRASIAVPLRAQSRRVGGLAVACQQTREWQEEEIHFVKMVGNELGSAAERLDLLQRLRVVNAKLRKALQAREEMIQNVSHELRTPLTIIRGYLELLLEDVLGPLQEEQRDALVAMLESADRLRFMIDRLLLMRSLDTYQSVAMPVELAAWLDTLLAEWRPRAEKAGVRLVLEVADPLPMVHTDPMLLEEVLTNLLDNAIKFSPNGGEVSIRAWPENGHIHIIVSDDGIGIPEEELERIFERFYQVDKGMARHFEGMGIGLALARHIMDMLGGRIWAESAGQNRGATFHVLLPVDGQQDTPGSASPG